MPVELIPHPVLTLIRSSEHLINYLFVELMPAAGAAMRKVAIAGVGYTPLTKNSGRSVLSLAAEACRNAASDAGLPLHEVDGVASFMVLNDSVSCGALASAVALPRLRWSMEFQHGGQSPCHVVGLAAMAVAAGHADSVLVFRALNGRSGVRVGSGQFAGGGAQYRYPIGYDAYMMYISMWARRYLHETGQDETDLGHVAVAQRKYAQMNERAMLRKPLDMAGYLASPYIAAPFRIADCTTEVDGACAVLVTSVERARDLKHPPAVIASTAFGASARPGLDIGDLLMSEDYTYNFTTTLRDDLYSRASLSPKDVQFAEIYDCFTSVVLMGLEGLGLCDRGTAGDFVAEGNTGLNGKLPVNTHGGLLAEGYLHGMNMVTEAALQVQGRAGERQVARHDVCVVTSGALADGSAMILTTDR
jgi:acetyl-CoA acetyltransferase